MIKNRPIVLSIAGYDPSGGAGVLADCKTMEAQKVTGMGIATCITFQNEDSFVGLKWFDEQDIFNQLKALVAKHTWKFVKIGMVPDFIFLQRLIDLLNLHAPGIKIIWDPVIQASAGFLFHETIDTSSLPAVCGKIYLMTPNWNEIAALQPLHEPVAAAANLSKYCKVYLKGGHHPTHIGKDYLFDGGEKRTYNTKAVAKYDKHGTGCVFSSALAANLARGYSLHQACLKSKKYIYKYLDSSKTKLGHHKI